MDHYLEPTMESGRAFMARGIAGSVVMLNLLRFRAVADYSRTPALAPAEPISGAAAFQRYIDHTLPFLKESGGKLLFLGSGGAFLIGPADERWDMAMLVRQSSRNRSWPSIQTRRIWPGLAIGLRPWKTPGCCRLWKPCKIQVRARGGHYLLQHVRLR